MDKNELTIEIRIDVKRWNTYGEPESECRIEITSPEYTSGMYIPRIGDTAQSMLESAIADYYQQRASQKQETEIEA